MPEGGEGGGGWRVYWDRRISRVELRAIANLLRNSRVGLPRPISRREMTDCLVPIFWASWA